MIQGLVAVNGEIETRRGRQLVKGDVVTLGGSRASRDPAVRPIVGGSADVDQVDDEDQRLAGLDDAAGAAVAVRRGAAG